MSPPRLPKEVSFAPSARIYLVPGLSEFTQKQIHQIWLQDEEEEASRDAVVSDVVIMRRLYKKGYSIKEILSGRENESTDDATCFRGIEHMVTSDASREKKARRKRAVRAVLVEQERQHQMGEEEPDLIASASLHATKYARDRAIEIASGDLRYVLNHVVPTMKIKRSNSAQSSLSSSSSSTDKRRALYRSQTPPTDTDEMSEDMDRSNHSHAHRHRPQMANEMLQQNLTALEMQLTSKLSFGGESRPPTPPSSIRQCQKAAKTA